jgi:hypothetical protein
MEIVVGAIVLTVIAAIQLVAELAKLVMLLAVLELALIYLRVLIRIMNALQLPALIILLDGAVIIAQNIQEVQQTMEIVMARVLAIHQLLTHAQEQGQLLQVAVLLVVKKHVLQMQL